MDRLPTSGNSEPIAPPNRQPFDRLDPECLLSALESEGFLPDGRIMALNSYENRVYQIGLEDQGFVVAKFYRPGRWTDEAILEEHALLEALHEAEIPVAPMLRNKEGSTLFHQAGFRFALCPRKAGRPPELEDPETLEALGRLIARLHQVAQQRPFLHRPTLDPDQYGTRALSIILKGATLGDSLIDAYRAAAEAALLEVGHVFVPNQTVMQTVHGDLYAGNLLMSPEGPLLLDFDDARTGPPIQDLWMLAQGDPSQRRWAMDALIEGYETFATLPVHSLRLIEALRTLRLMHLTAWLVERQGDPAFPSAFPKFGSEADWQERILDLEDQIDRMKQVRQEDVLFPI